MWETQRREYKGTDMNTRVEIRARVGMRIIPMWGSWGSAGGKKGRNDWLSERMAGSYSSIGLWRGERDPSPSPYLSLLFSLLVLVSISFITIAKRGVGMSAAVLEARWRRPPPDGLRGQRRKNPNPQRRHRKGRRVYGNWGVIVSRCHRHWWRWVLRVCVYLHFFSWSLIFRVLDRN